METIQSTSLYFQSGSSDKEYHLQLIKNGDSYAVNFQYGRRGSTLKDGCKATTTDESEARKVYDSVFREKTGKGYVVGESTGTGYTQSQAKEKTVHFIPQLPNPIDEAEMEHLLRDDAWGVQEKKDGKHILLHKRDSSQTVAYNKKGIEVGYPETFSGILSQPGLIDGEAIGDTYHVFDALELDGRDLRSLGYHERYKILANTELGSAAKLVGLAIGYRAKKLLLDNLRAGKKEGIVFKRLDAPFSPGRPNSGGDMLKFKFYASASCIVSGGRKGKRSVSLELVDGGNRVAVGNVTIPANKEIPMIGTVVEIQYLYAYEGGSLYQPIYLGPRDDIDTAECLVKQLKYKSEED